MALLFSLAGLSLAMGLSVVGFVQAILGQSLIQSAISLMMFCGCAAGFGYVLVRAVAETVAGFVEDHMAMVHHKMDHIIDDTQYICANVEDGNEPPPE